MNNPLTPRAHLFCHYCGTRYEEYKLEKPPYTCSNCEHMVWKNPTPVVVCLTPVLDGTRLGLLVVERKLDPIGWALPGGFMESDESVAEASVRELKEETGIVLPPEVREHSTRSTGTQVLLFSQTRAITLDQLPRFVPNNEVSDVDAIFGKEFINFVFPLHEEAAENFFDTFFL